MNAMAMLRAHSAKQQAPENTYRRRKYSTSDEAHARLVRASEELGLTISAALEALILDGIPGEE